jgi:CRP-like cAMP-binding protein
MSSLRYRVQANVLQNLRYAGIRVPRQAVDYLDLNHPMQQPDAVADDVAFLRNVDLFATLDTDELSSLRKSMRLRHCAAGTPVITEGAESLASLFVVKEGFLEVRVRDDTGADVTVGYLEPGEVFGEMSLLTGAAPSATVTPQIDAVLAEITHDGLKPLLKARKDLISHLGAVVAERQMRNNKSLQRTSPAARQAQREKLAARIISSIVSFFGLNGGQKRGAGGLESGS